jgi:hypothetical protein
LYNPDNFGNVSGYPNDEALHDQAEEYITTINNAIIAANDGLNYRVVDVHSTFETNYAIKNLMGQITSFYPLISLFEIRIRTKPGKI